MEINQQKTGLFLIQLRAIAKRGYGSHRELAQELDIPVWQLRNWLYRDKPSPFVVRALFPIVSRKYQALKNGK